MIDLVRRIVVTSSKQRILEKLGLEDRYEIRSEEGARIRFLDKTRNLEFLVQWKTFRKFCRVPGYTFSATTEQGKVALWQSKLDCLAAGRFRVIRTEMRKRKLILWVEEGSRSYSISAYYLVRELKKDPKVTLKQEALTVKGKSIADTAKDTGYSRTYLYPLLSARGEESLSAVPEGGRDNRTLIESIVQQWLPDSAIVDKMLPGTGYRPDFRIESPPIIIECDGLYWHSDVFRGKGYHREKKLAYESAGYRSYFFREDEIHDKTEIVRSVVTNALSESVRVFARKTTIRPALPSFFQENHLMGKGAGRVYGLYQADGTLVAGIQVKWRDKATRILEVSRFCTLLGTSVVGGFSKAIAHVINEERPWRIVTYIDRRYGSGDYLESLGWNKTKETVSFSWVKGSTAAHRMKFPSNSGYAEGWNKMWDCGQARWELEVKR